MKFSGKIIVVLLFIGVPSWAENVAHDFLVYKHPQCGCCSKWMTHLTEHGYEVEHQDLQNEHLSALKEKYLIKPKYQSCHTAVTKDGYLFEGHIPAFYIKQFLNDKPEGSIGLAVPGMPVGSPGMEMDDRRDEYKVLLLNQDGTASVYAVVNAKENINE